MHRAGPVVLDHDIGRRREPVQRRLSLGTLEVDGDAAFIAIEGGKEAGGEPAQSTGVIAARRRFNLHHVCPELGKDQPGRRTHHGVAELENLEAG